MFCPKCATQNLEGASFCRTCGANISLVPQALTGQMVEVTRDKVVVHARRGRKRHREATLESAFKNVAMGFAFLVISIALSRTIGQGWWFWLLIPAFSLVSSGIAQFIRVKEQEKRSQIAGPGEPQTLVIPRRTDDTLPRRTDELRPPVPSVTEGTTRHLGVEAPTRHLDASERK